MSNIRYIPIEKNMSLKSLLFDVQLARKSDGYWFAWIAVLPGCAAWGASKDEALAMLTQTARTYVRMFSDKGVPVPERVETINAPMVAVILSLFFSCRKEYDGKEIFRNPDQRDPAMQKPQR